MGKQPAQFIPVKYVNTQDEEEVRAFIMNVIFAALAMGAALHLYRRGKAPKPGAKGKSAKKSEGGGSWFGNNMMGDV